MTITDWIGFIGVSILLTAYFLNLTNKIQKDGITYLFLNLLGAGIACVASLLLHYLPFIILEGAWTLVSAYGLYQFYSKKEI
jgi:hypothetical protein